MVVGDEIWRPGYSGPPPVSGETSLDGANSLRQDSSGAVRGAPRRSSIVAGAVAVVSTVIVSVLVANAALPEIELRGATDVIPPIDVVDDDRLQFSTEDGADFTDGEPLRLLDRTATPLRDVTSRRLPVEVVPRWTTELAPLVADGGSNATSWVKAIDRRYVVVGVGDLRTLTGPAAIQVLDATTGERLWVHQVESRIDQVEFIAAVGEALVLTIGSEVLALDLRDGSALWSTRLEKGEGGLQQIEHLKGTDLLALSGPDSELKTELIDPSTGAVVGELIGTVLGADAQGRWSVLRGDKLLAFDLGRQRDDESTGSASTPKIESRLLGVVDSERGRVAAVVGGSLVTTVNGMLAVGPLEVDGQRVVGPGGYTPVKIDLGTPDWLLTVGGIIPLGGSAFAAVGSASVIGAEVVDGSIRFAWQRRGVVTASFDTERGVVLVMGTDGGSAQTLIDASTGDAIAPLTMAPGLFDSLDVVANGIVTRRASPSGARIAGLDLDGNELWSLDGSTPVSVGDGIVVRSTPQPDGSFEVTAFGELV